MTFGGKKYDTSSKLNKVPPMGAPKATATPAAHAALRISRRFAVNINIVLVSQIQVVPKRLAPTFIVLVFWDESAYYVANAARDVNKWALFTEGQTRCHGQR
jgi:hypothetical protein